MEENSVPQIDTRQVQEVLQRVMRGKQFVEPWRMNINKWRNLYAMQHNPDQYKDPTHTNAVDLAVGIMLANKKRWHSYGIEPSKREQNDTGLIEKLIESIWEINDQREEKSNDYELFLNFARDGGAVLYSVFDPAIAMKVQDQVEMIDPNSETGTVIKNVYKEPPMRVQVIDPYKVFMIPGGPKRWLMIGRSEEMSVLDAEMAYGIKIPKFAHLTDEDKSITKDEFLDVWDYVTQDGQVKVRNTVLFAQHPLMGPRIMEGYEELAYVIQFFKPTDSHDPKKWHNIMSAQETSVELLEKAVDRRSKQIDIYTALPIVSRTQPGRVVQVDSNLFNHVNLSPDESIEFPNWPGNAPDVQLHLDFLRGRVNQSGFSEVMFGMGSGDSAGYAMAQMGDQNRIRLEQPIYHIELLLTTWAKRTMYLLCQYAYEFSICIYGEHKGKSYSEYVNVKDLKGYAVKAEIIPSFPAEETRKVAMATQSKGTLSDYTILERFYNIEQPEDELERRMIEITSAHPMVIEYAIMSELNERANDGDEIAIAVLEKMQQEVEASKMQMEKTAMDMEANNPEQFSGMPSATGQPTSQEAGGPPAGQSAQERMQKQVGLSPKLKA